MRNFIRSNSKRVIPRLALGGVILLAGAVPLLNCGTDATKSATGTTGDCTLGNGGATSAVATTGTVGSTTTAGAGGGTVAEDPLFTQVKARLNNGREVFRHDTFGDEAFWGDALHLHEAIAGSANGGVGPGVNPKTALALGLKVDQDALPAAVVAAIQANQVDLTDPKTTVTLLQLDAVVGVKGLFDTQGALKSVGIECALCHSTVDDAFAPGIGHRLDGWPNRDLNVGAIIAASPDLTPIQTVLGVDNATLLSVLNSWGPGKFDAEVLLDGKAFRPDGTDAATLIPAAFGQSGVNLGTYTGWGSTTQWNAFVANLEMHGQGTYFDPRLNDATRFPVAAANNFGAVTHAVDLVTPKLADLHFYELALEPPQPPAASFDAQAATRGADVFNGKAKCSTSHVPPLFTEPGWNLHTASEIGIDDFQAQRSPEARYRTTPLRGLYTREKGGFYHDGRFATIDEVVTHYNTFLSLGLTASESSDLTQYLKSL